MVHLLMKDITKLLNNRSNIRNIAVIGLSDDDGTETLIDFLISFSGIVAADNFPPYAPWVECNPRELYVEPAACVSLYATMGNKSDDVELSNQYIINLILNDNQNAVLQSKIADGVVIVVDSNQNINPNTQILIQNSIMEKLKIILFINNIDTNLLTVSAANLDFIYRDLKETIEQIQSLINQHTDDKLYSLDVMKNIIFGCAKDRWAFNLHNFADIYSKSFSRMDGKKLAEKLWAENYYSFMEKKWSSIRKDDTYERSFVRFVLEPMHKLYNAVLSNNSAEIDNIISKLNIQLEDYEREKTGTKLLNKIMQKWLPVSNNILPIIISHLPSPIVAQKYRFDVIYKGFDKKIIDLIKNPQENGQFFMVISKTLWTNDQGRRYAFGRIFSGALKKGDTIRVVTNEGTFDKKKVEKILFLCGRFVEEISDTFCGSICALSGLQSCINGAATLTAADFSKT